MTINPFRWRVFISFALTLSFLVLMLSGIVLYLSPPGRIANWSGWQLLGLGKRDWQNQHTIFGFAFIILSIFHLFVINWSAFLSYLKTKASKGLRSPVELLSVSLLFILFAAGTHLHLPPFTQVIKWGDELSESWERTEKKPPVPHAETLTLDELAKLPQIASTSDKLLRKLKAAGITVRDTKQSLQEIATENGREITAVYAIIAAERTSGTLTGTGWGQRSLREAAEASGVSPEALRMALEQQGIKALPEETLRVIAERSGIPVPELVSRIEAITERR